MCCDTTLCSAQARSVGSLSRACRRAPRCQLDFAPRGIKAGGRGAVVSMTPAQRRRPSRSESGAAVRTAWGFDLDVAQASPHSVTMLLGRCTCGSSREERGFGQEGREEAGPAKKAVKRAPAKKAVKRAPARKAVKRSPAKKAAKRAPAGKAVKKRAPPKKRQPRSGHPLARRPRSGLPLSRRRQPRSGQPHARLSRSGQPLSRRRQPRSGQPPRKAVKKRATAAKKAVRGAPARKARTAVQRSVPP